MRRLNNHPHRNPPNRAPLACPARILMHTGGPCCSCSLRISSAWSCILTNTLIVYLVLLHFPKVEPFHVSRVPLRHLAVSMWSTQLFLSFLGYVPQWEMQDRSYVLS